MSTNAEAAAPTAHRQVQVVYKATGSLVPDPRNARTHPKRQIDQIVASIRAFGFTNPILADPEGNLIAGHRPSGPPGIAAASPRALLFLAKRGNGLSIIRRDSNSPKHPNVFIIADDKLFAVS